MHRDVTGGTPVLVVGMATLIIRDCLSHSRSINELLLVFRPVNMVHPVIRPHDIVTGGTEPLLRVDHIQVLPSIEMRHSTIDIHCNMTGWTSPVRHCGSGSAKQMKGPIHHVTL
jgi:hypothetical protein